MEKGNGLFHALDKWCGIVIVLVLGLFKFKKHPVPKIVQRIAILNLGSIGDNVLMSAVIADLKLKYPDTEFVVFTGGSNYDIVKLIPGIDKVKRLSVTHILRSRTLMKQEGEFDILFDFGPWPRINAIFSYFIKAKCKIGFKAEKQYRHYLYDVTVMHSSEVHEIENYRNLVQLVNKNGTNRPKIQLVKTYWTNKITGALGKYCIIHPWPGGYKSYMKEWPADNWAKLIELISRNFDTLVITGAPSDLRKTQDLLQMIDKNAGFNIVNLCGKVSLIELTHLLSEASMIFSVNTGIAHMAAAFESKQVCLHGPTNVKRWRPYSDTSVCVVPEKGTYGYLNFGYEYDKAKENSMVNISPESVYQAYLGLAEYAQEAAVGIK